MRPGGKKKDASPAEALPSRLILHKENIRRDFLKLLSERSPSSALWHDLIPIGSFKWPEWSKTAFAKERHDWLVLSQSTVKCSDSEVKHWGRFARLAANRIAQGGWQSPLAPVRTLRASLFTLWLLDSQGEEIDWESTLKSASNWLRNTRDQLGGDFFVRAQLHDECEDLKTWTGMALADRNLSHSIESLHLSLDDYGVFIQQQEACSMDVPWATSAHVDAWEWHSRRLASQIRSQCPVPILPTTALTDNFPWHIFPRETHAKIMPSQYRLLPMLDGSSFVRIGPQPVIFYGPNAQISIFLSQIFLWWASQFMQDRLSFLLTEPPIFESIMYSLMACLPESIPDAMVRWSANWRNTIDVLALGDAWLWLEGADPEVVKAWMQGALGNRRADWWVLRLKTDPSHLLIVQTLAEEILEQCLSHGLDWPGFSQGPVIYTLP